MLAYNDDEIDEYAQLRFESFSISQWNELKTPTALFGHLNERFRPFIPTSTERADDTDSYSIHLNDFRFVSGN